MTLPKIIQGGMGVAISDYRLARAVARTGQLGVVSGTGIALVLIGRLMSGSTEARDALMAFPFPEIAERILRRYYIAGGMAEGSGFKRPPMWTLSPSPDLEALTVAANFVEVYLARQGHDNPVGINLLEKIQLPTMASLYGAMLAGVDYVLMGAGIPLQIPGILDQLATHQPVSYRVDVQGATQEYHLSFTPQKLFPLAGTLGALKRPAFLPIISSFVLAQALLKRATGRIDGFVIETPVAGGHNAPPRGQYPINELGEPVYGEKDAIDYERIRGLGLPFWIGGGYGSPEKLEEALALGAAGIQVGTAFAYCDESGMVATVKQAVVQAVLDDGARVRTSAVASPTGFPFKVVQIPGTLAEPEIYEDRDRVCDIGYLRHLIEMSPGQVGYRCPSEPVDQYVRKGGDADDTVGRVCLCNALGSAAGFGQTRRDGYEEPALITSGDDLINLGRLVPAGQTHYSASDVIRYLLGQA